jgi:hypothetical protein
MCLFAQNWEVFAESLPIERARCNLVHSTICYTRAYAPVYSTKLKELQELQC